MKAENLQFSEKYMSNMYDARLFRKILVNRKQRPLCATGRTLIVNQFAQKLQK